MTHKKTVWIINPYDPLPGEALQPVRYGFLADALIQRGHRVVWWTSSFSHLTKTKRAIADIKSKPGLDIRLTAVPPYRANTGLGRLWNHLLFEFRFYRSARLAEPRPDLILASLPPLFAPWLAMKLANRWGVVGVLDVQDLWPDAWTSLFPARVECLIGKLLRPLFALRQATAARAKVVTGVSRAYAAAVATSHERPLRAFPLGADLVKFEGGTSISMNLPEKGEHDIWLLRAGVVGHFCDGNLLLQAAAILKESDPRIKILVAGGGPHAQALREKAKAMKLNNFVCLGQYPRDDFSLDDVRALHVIADVALCVYTKTAVQSLVNKAFGYMAAGLPIINSVSGEMAEIIETEGIGLNYMAGDVQGFVAATQHLASSQEARCEMGRKAQDLAKTRYDKKVIYSEYADYLEQLMGSNKSRL